MWHVWKSGNLMTASAFVGVAAGGGKGGGEEDEDVFVKKGGEEEEDGDGLRKVYQVNAPLFFGSTRPMLRVFDYLEDPEDVVIDLNVSHGGIMDLSGITALNEAGKSYCEVGKRVTLIGLDPQSMAMIARYPDSASHLNVPGLRSEGGMEGCMGEVLTVGPEGIELGLEMSVDVQHPMAEGEGEWGGVEEGRVGGGGGKVKMHQHHHQQH
jgi:hypothetical protein